MSTIRFFDGFDMALAPFEIWFWLLNRGIETSYEATRAEILRLLESKKIELTNSFVTLQGRAGMAEERIRRGLFAEDKIHRARKAIRMLRFVPYVRMVAVCNTLAFDMTRKEGDIDVFIVMSRNRLYFSRFFVTSLLHLTRRRRHGLKIQNRVCLSFYADEQALDMSTFALDDGDDPYLAYWTRSLVPMFSVNGTYDRYWNQNKAWLKKYFSDPQPYIPVERRTIKDALWVRGIRGFFEFLLFPFAVILEPLLFMIQRRKLSRSSERHLRLNPTSVIVERHVCKFHEEDRRVFYRTHMQTAKP